MIFIADDLFPNDKLNYLIGDEKYFKYCRVYSIIKTIDIENLEKELSDCKLFCNHKSLQLYDTNSKPINSIDNNNLLQKIINTVTQMNIQRVEFSGGLWDNFGARKIRRDTFYKNLKIFLDSYIKSNKIELKVLFDGPAYNNEIKFSVIENMISSIRFKSIVEYYLDIEISEGIKIIYPNKKAKDIIEIWEANKFTKDDIIKEINNQII